MDNYEETVTLLLKNLGNREIYEIKSWIIKVRNNTVKNVIIIMFFINILRICCVNYYWIFPILFQ